MWTDKTAYTVLDEVIYATDTHQVKGNTNLLLNKDAFIDKKKKIL